MFTRGMMLPHLLELLSALNIPDCLFDNGIDILLHFFDSSGSINDMPRNLSLAHVLIFQLSKPLSDSLLQFLGFISFFSVSKMIIKTENRISEIYLTFLLLLQKDACQEDSSFHLPSSLFSLFLRQVQEDDGIWSRESHIWCLTPSQRKVSFWFSTRKGHTAVCISIADDGRPVVQLVHKLLGSFPSIRRKEQMDGSIIQITIRLKILVD